MSWTIAVLGTGGMGSGMAHRLLERGFALRVWNRSPARTGPLAELGAYVAGSPADAARGADAVLVSLADAAAVQDVLFGPVGATRGLREGGVIVDTSTTSADAAVAIGAAAHATGHLFVEARVLGNPHHARSGQLRVLAGGPAHDCEAARPVLAALGKELTVLGTWGTGARMKIALNLFLGVQLAGLAEAVDIGEAAGLDRSTVLAVLSTGGYASPVVAFRRQLIDGDRLEPAAFRLDLMEKDMGLALDLAGSCGVDSPVTASAADRFRAGVRSGLGRLDVAAVVRPSRRPRAVAS